MAQATKTTRTSGEHAQTVRRFAERLQDRTQHLVTSEIVPPKGTDVADIVAKVGQLRGAVDAINVTDGSGAIMRASSLAISKVVLDAGVDPIFQITCRDRNRLALQADLLGAYILGIRNILALTGDDPKAGDHPDAKAVFDLTSAQLMQAARGMSEGQDLAGKELQGTTQFCIGAAADPGAKDLDTEFKKLEAKIAGGAAFFQTQAVFKAEPVRRFMARANSYGKPVLVGCLFLKSAKMARYMNEHVWGIHVPDDQIARLERAKDPRAESLAMMIELLTSIKDVADGFHLYPLGWDELVPPALRAAGIR